MRGHAWSQKGVKGGMRRSHSPASLFFDTLHNMSYGWCLVEKRRVLTRRRHVTQGWAPLPSTALCSQARTRPALSSPRAGASCATRPTLVPSQRSSLSPRRDRARQLSPHTCTRARSKARREYSRGSRSRRRVQEPAHHSLRTSIAQQRSPTRKLRSAGSFGARGLAGRGSYPRIVASSSRRTCRTERRG